MREILFRGKRVNDGEWIEGGIIPLDVERELIFITEQFFAASILPEHLIIERRTHPVIAETVGQYTGLTDKNGKKIFEGDIIRYADELEYRCYLESLEIPEDYIENAFANMWTVDEIVYCIQIGYPAFDLNRHNFEINGLSELSESCQYFYEVIGNIHDNPELLEVR